MLNLEESSLNLSGKILLVRLRLFVRQKHPHSFCRRRDSYDAVSMIVKEYFLLLGGDLISEGSDAFCSNVQTSRVQFRERALL